MGKYSKYMRKSAPRKMMSPLWKGIGCVLMLIVPAISYGLAYVFLQEAKRLSLVPPGLLGHFQFPAWAWNFRPITTILQFLASLKDAWAMVIFFLVILFIISGLVSLIYSAIYQMIGPSRYTDLDAPPTNRKVKEYKR